MIEFLIEVRPYILTLHLAAMAVGVGTATLTDIFFFRFIKDLSFSKMESGIMRTFSKVIWVALIVIIISGLGLYLPAASEYNTVSKFLVKMVIVAVIVINGLILNLAISPRMPSLSFTDNRHKTLRRCAFAFGSVSLISWYSALILGAMSNINLPFMTILGVYLILLVIAITGGQLMERRLVRKAKGL